MNASLTKRRRAALFMATVGLVAGVARGDVHVWIGSTEAYWSNPACWSPYGVPTDGDSAVIRSPFLTAPASRTVYYDGAGYNVRRVNLGSVEGYTGTVNHWDSYTLNTHTLEIGEAGRGYYNQGDGARASRPCYAKWVCPGLGLEALR